MIVSRQTRNMGEETGFDLQTRARDAAVTWCCNYSGTKELNDSLFLIRRLHIMNVWLHVALRSWKNKLADLGLTTSLNRYRLRERSAHSAKRFPLNCCISCCLESQWCFYSTTKSDSLLSHVYFLKCEKTNIYHRVTDRLFLFSQHIVH